MLLGDVANDAEHSRARRSLERLQHDVDRKFGAVLAQSEEIHGRAHLAGAGMGMVIFAMRGMAHAEALRNEIFDGLADQLGLRVTK